jgi:hypothetical protein
MLMCLGIEKPCYGGSTWYAYYLVLSVVCRLQRLQQFVFAKKVMFALCTYSQQALHLQYDIVLHPGVHSSAWRIPAGVYWPPTQCTARV